MTPLPERRVASRVRNRSNFLDRRRPFWRVVPLAEQFRQKAMTIRYAEQRAEIRMSFPVPITAALIGGFSVFAE